MHVNLADVLAFELYVVFVGGHNTMLYTLVLVCVSLGDCVWVGGWVDMFV